MTRTPAEWMDLFERDLLDPQEFHHRDHVALAWALLRRDPPLQAMAAYIEGLRALTRRVGRPDVYHATITWALLLLIHERIGRQPTAEWDEFAAANEDLFAWKPSILDRYYRAETLGSDLARQVFLLPDRLAAGLEPLVAGAQ